MIQVIPPRHLGTVQSAARIAIGLAYFSHGAQKIFGWFGGMGPDGGTVDLMTRFGAAGIIEVVCGACIVLGLFTAPAAFLASGEMAVGYFWMHAGRSGSIWWWENRGEVLMIFSFFFLLVSVMGPGPFSLDAMMARRRGGLTPSGSGSST